MGMGYGRTRSHEDIERIDNLKQQRDQLREALEAAVECGMVPNSSAKNGGASRHARQVVVADMIRAALKATEAV